MIVNRKEYVPMIDGIEERNQGKEKDEVRIKVVDRENMNIID